MRLGVALLLASLALLVAVPQTGAFASHPDAGAAKAKAKCKQGQVPVTVNRKKGCRPFSQLFPKPKQVDPRLAHLQQALKFDPAKTPSGKQRRRARTLQSGFGAAGRRAQKRLLRVLPRALTLIDRKGRGARSSRLPAGPAFASQGCGPGPAGPTSQTGGATIGALGDNGGFIEAPAGGLRVRVTFYSCGGVNNYRIPECPTANGSVDATGTGEFRATIEVLDGDRVASRNSTTFEEKAKVRGEVGADARLNFIDLEHTRELFLVASGGIVIRGGVTRRVRIEMPAGRYDSAQAGVRFFGDSLSGDAGAKDFANSADAAIRGYRSAEPRWSSFERKPHCAEPVFSPAINTLKLGKGEAGQLGISAKAQGGGNATAARWTLLGAENANFTPSSSEAAAPTVSYEVTNAPQNGFVRVTARFTSTAGVGEGTWVQPTEQKSIEKIAGTFSVSERLTGTVGTSVFEWAGNATFERLGPSIGGPNGTFKLSSGLVTVTVSGKDVLIVGSTCSQKGSGQFALSPNSEFFVLGTLPSLTEPFDYSFSLFTADAPPDPKIEVTLFACGEGAEELEGDTFMIPVPLMFQTSESHQSADGIDYEGSETQSVPNYVLERDWLFHGSE